MRSSPLSSADLIRVAAVKVTPGRVRVLDALRAAPKALSHGELERHLASGEAAAIGRVTLYRILDSLIACNLAHRAADARGIFRYSAARTAQSGRAGQPHGDHVHFHCVLCGGVYCLKTGRPPPPSLPRGFRLDTVDYDVRGACATCIARC